MEIITAINHAIDYIEDHLESSLEVEDIAKAACSSRYHFQRTFHILTGITVAEYIRNRRMTLAAQELMKGSSKIIDVVLKYGYESPDAFTKAFQRLHGVTPLSMKKGNVLEEARQKLFDRILDRAMELRLSRPDLSTRIYAGFPYDEDLLAFYLGNGFENDFSVIMEDDITCMPDPLPNHIMVEEWDLRTDQDYDEYEAIYNEIFVSPLDRDQYMEQQKEKNFKNLSFSIDGCKEAGCTIFEKDSYGYIETVFVSEGKRGKGLARNVMDYIFAYFASIGIRKSKLEVWKINKRAVVLYESYGFREVDKNLMFPGITR